jgi:hypothetical protein
MFQSLFGKFVSAQVILFTVMLSSNLVGMGGKQVELRGPLVCVFHRRSFIEEWDAPSPCKSLRSGRCSL